MIGDPIGDLITRIKNAGMADQESVVLPYSKMKHTVCEVLSREGYIGAVKESGKGIKKNLTVEVLYVSGKPRVANTKRISKPSKRVYYAVDDIQPVRNGFGLLVLSTPQGIMTGAEARQNNVGGEALFQVW